MVSRLCPCGQAGIYASLRFSVGFFEVGDDEPEVLFGSGRGAVAEDLLDMAQVGTIYRQIRVRLALNNYRQAGIYTSLRFSAGFFEVGAASKPFNNLAIWE